MMPFDKFLRMLDLRIYAAQRNLSIAESLELFGLEDDYAAMLATQLRAVRS